MKKNILFLGIGLFLAEAHLPAAAKRGGPPPPPVEIFNKVTAALKGESQPPAAQPLGSTLTHLAEALHELFKMAQQPTKKPVAPPVPPRNPSAEQAAAQEVYKKAQAILSRSEKNKDDEYQKIITQKTAEIEKRLAERLKDCKNVPTITEFLKDIQTLVKEASITKNQSFEDATSRIVTIIKQQKHSDPELNAACSKIKNNIQKCPSIEHLIPMIIIAKRAELVLITINKNEQAILLAAKLKAIKAANTESDEDDEDTESDED